MLIKNKIKTQSVLLIIIGFLVFPLITMAAWWNPFSWNWDNIFNTIMERPQVSSDINDFSSIENVSMEDDFLLIKKDDKIKDPEIVDKKEFKKDIIQQEELKIVEKPEIELKQVEDNSVQSKTEGFTLEELESMGAKPIIQITEENFYIQLLSLYNNKIDFLDDKIKLWGLMNFARDLSIKGKEDDFVFCKELTSKSGYDTSYATSIYELEIDEGYKIFEIWEARIDQYKGIKRRIENQLVDIVEKYFFSEAEYLLRQKELNVLVNEDLIAEEDDSICDNVYFTADKIAELDEKILARAEKDQAEEEKEIDKLQKELNELEEQILDNKIKMINANLNAMEIVKQPTEIRCETSRDGKTTVCSNIFSGESIRCTSINSFGKTTTTCKENLLGH